VDASIGTSVAVASIGPAPSHGKYKIDGLQGLEKSFLWQMVDGFRLTEAADI
jgi:hypothetical protein